MTIQDFCMDDATPSQRQVMEYVQARHKAGERGMVWWMGGVRAGKSFGACIAMLEHQRHRTGKQYMVLAYTAGQAINVFGTAMERIAAEMGYETKLNRSAANPRLLIKDNGNEFLFRGADKAGRDRAIQGLTLSGLIVDETPNLMRDTVHQAEARVSGHGGLRIYTANKTSPFHWTTKYYLERLTAKSIDGLVVDCTMADNPHIDSAFASERAGEFTGDTLTRFIGNEFTLDRPPIYRPGMGPPPEASPGKTLISLYGHPGGYECIEAQWLGQTLMVTGATSCGAYEDLPIQHEEVLLNGHQGLLARRLRRHGIAVKGYREGHVPANMAILQEACKRSLLWVTMEAASLWEAIQTYSVPGRYDWPAMVAFEALALPLRSHVS